VLPEAGHAVLDDPALNLRLELTLSGVLDVLRPASAPPLPSVDPAPNSLFEGWLQQMKKLFSPGKITTNPPPPPSPPPPHHHPPPPPPPQKKSPFYYYFFFFFSFFFSFFFFYYYYYHYSYFYYFYFYYFNYYYYHYLRLTRSMSSAQRSAPPLPSVDPAPNSLFESWLQQMKKLFSLGKEITNYY